MRKHIWLWILSMVAVSLLQWDNVVSTANGDTTAEQQGIPVDKIRVADGFKVELLYSVPKSEQGSWVSMTSLPDGKLIVSDQEGGLYRITPSPIDGTGETKVEPLKVDIGSAQGLLYAFDSLYVVVNGNYKGKQSGLYRCQDRDKDGELETVTLLRSFEGGGEHGPHAVILSFDQKSLYICAGNHTKLTPVNRSRVPQNWDEDQLLPRMWDAGGHAVGILAPGGWIVKTDSEGKEFELISSGFRNQYDIALNPLGDLFTYDADMEWDIGAPWYRPTRVCFAASGSEFGWRSGTGKWPAFSPDSLDSAVDVGPGSPTGITFGTGAKFPEKYQKALFILDWSYGIVYAAHLEQKGAGYSGELEEFISAPALQGTDIVVNPVDHALYFTIGGRKTQSALYRVTYIGKESTAAAEYEPLNELHLLRRKIETLHVANAPNGVETAWPYLAHDDRNIRYAARVAIEHQPVASWAKRALAETNPDALVQSIIALTRCGTKENQDAALEALGRLDYGKLELRQRLDLLRAYGLTLIRWGDSEAAFQAIGKRLDSYYPATDTEENMELCRILCKVESPKVIERTLALLARAPTQEEQIHYVYCLRPVKSGWSVETRTQYFDWFLTSSKWSGGNSFAGFLENIRKEAIDNMTDSQRQELSELLAKKPVVTDPGEELKSRPFFKQWKPAELLALLENPSTQPDLENGRNLFSVTQCFKCHRMQRQGGVVGPDLTGISRRYSLPDLVDAIVDPSKVISDQYQATTFEMIDGKVITGRVANLFADTYLVQVDMLKPGTFTNIDKEQVESMSPSKISMMPNGLLDTLNEKEIIDLFGYLRSASGDKPTLKKTK